MSTPIHLAKLSLEGLSVGDAFGQRFFDSRYLDLISRRELPPSPWPWTDDTAMASGIVVCLEEFNSINQPALAKRFADSYANDSGRGYGPLMHRVLRDIGAGEPWEIAAGRVHDGEGSLGNGGAMRAGPLGAYFSSDLKRTVEQARLSAMVTHAHAEGIAGAIAVAVAAATACETAGCAPAERRDAIAARCMELTPTGATHRGIEKATRIDLDYDPQTAASAVGNGSRLRADDTVPFAIWCAMRHIDDFEEAMWQTVGALGDRDTTCAIVGSIVALSVGRDEIPQDWVNRREPLPIR